jgi:predicted GNAT family N-acyltransferase
MYIQEITFGTPEFDEAVQLRYQVLRQPLGLEYSEGQLAEEWDQIHLGAYSANGQLIGYLNLTPDQNGQVKMRQVAVTPNLQGKGVGKQLVEASEIKAYEAGFSKMVLHARESAVAFYKTLGYQITGDSFEEVSIPHLKMWKSIK